MLGTLTTRDRLNPHISWDRYGKSESNIFVARVGVEVEGAGGRKVRRLAIAVGERAYVLPLWSTVQSADVCFDQGYVWFGWTPTQEGYQNVVNSDAHKCIVVFRPDGEVEEFRGFMAQIIGGKVFSIRPYNWDDPAATTSSILDPQVAVWGDTQGPQFPEIRCVVDAGGVPVYMARKDGRYWGDYPVQSTKAVMQHPDTVLFEGRAEDWHMISKTPEALSDEHGVYGVPSRMLIMPDGTPVYGISDNKTVTIFRGRSPVVKGDLIAFHRRESDQVLTVIERTPGNGRKIHELR